jgi:hypothetical protein
MRAAALLLLMFFNGAILAQERPWGDKATQGGHEQGRYQVQGYLGRYNPWSGNTAPKLKQDTRARHAGRERFYERRRAQTPPAVGGYGSYPPYGANPYGGYWGGLPGGAYSPYPLETGYPYPGGLYEPFGASGWGNPFGMFWPGLSTW